MADHDQECICSRYTEDAAATVYMVRKREGKPSQVVVFIQSLPEGDQAKVIALIDRLAKYGHIANAQKCKRLEKDLWELKSYQVRIAFFKRDGGKKIFLAHGFKKKKDAWPPEELKKARKARDAHDDHA